MPGTSEALLAGLDPEQRQVALAARGPVCVLAGAGTGKTRAITYRIAYAALSGTVDPAHVLALTFTVRAAGELRGRLRQLGVGQVRASTFHAAALRQLNYFWPRVVGGRPPQLIDSKAGLVREAAKRARVRLDGTPGALADTAAEIEWAKVIQVRPDGYPAAAAVAGRSAVAGADNLAAVYAAYEELRRERHLIDFESVLELTAAILIDSRAAAGQVHDIFRHFVVDEYQDVNPLQKLLLEAWLGDRDDLCVVGDPNQVIYSFTGATSTYLTGFTAEFPAATVVRLVRDYRSTPQVVAVANQLVRSASPLAAQRPPGPRPVLIEYPDDAAEAAGLASRVRTLMTAGVPAREIAILVRVNADTERFELALAEAGLPYVIRGAERFYDRPVVRQALVLLRGAARGAAAGDSSDSLPDSVRHVLTGIGLTPRPPSGLRGAASVRENWESLAAIAQLADDMHAAAPEATLADFSAELTMRADLGHAPAVDGVTLASMHAAKGLEWDAVLLPGLVDGLMPIVHARTAEALEEQLRRLASVPLEERRGMRPLDPDRAPVIVGGAVIAREILAYFGLDKLEISERDILDGAALAAAELPEEEEGAAPPGAYTCC